MRYRFLAIIGFSAFSLLWWMVSGIVRHLSWEDAALLAIGCWAIRISVAMLLPRIVGIERTWRFRTLIWCPELWDDRIVAVSPVADVLQLFISLSVISAVFFTKVPFSTAELLIATAVGNVMMIILQIVDWLYVRKYSRLQ